MRSACKTRSKIQRKHKATCSTEQPVLARLPGNVSTGRTTTPKAEALPKKQFRKTRSDDGAGGRGHHRERFGKKGKRGSNEKNACGQLGVWRVPTCPSPCPLSRFAADLSALLARKNSAKSQQSQQSILVSHVLLACCSKMSPVLGRTAPNSHQQTTMTKHSKCLPRIANKTRTSPRRQTKINPASTKLGTNNHW